MLFSETQKGVLAIVLLSFGFGLFAVITRYLGESFTLFQQLYLTFGMGFVVSVFLFPYTLTPTRLRQIPLRDWKVILFRVVVGSILASILYRESLLIAKISNVVFLQSLPFIAIFGWLLFKERLTRQKVFFLTLSFVGVVVLSRPNDLTLNLGTGELLSIISGALFALAFLSRRWQTDFLNDKEMSQISLGATAFGLFILSFFSADGVPAAIFDSKLFLVIALSGMFLAGNTFFVNYGFRRVEPSLANNILTLEAVFGTLLAYFFFGELPLPIELFGGILVILAAIGMNRVADHKGSFKQIK